MNLNKSKKSLCCDYLIIGSGLTGMTAAIELSKFGKVIVATKAEAIESNSFYAQKGP